MWAITKIELYLSVWILKTKILNILQYLVIILSQEQIQDL